MLYIYISTIFSYSQYIVIVCRYVYTLYANIDALLLDIVSMSYQGMKGANTTTEFWPPNPNEFDMAANITKYLINNHNIIINT